jgi:hypothetical protein
MGREVDAKDEGKSKRQAKKKGSCSLRHARLDASRRRMMVVVVVSVMQADMWAADSRGHGAESRWFVQFRVASASDLQWGCMPW